MQQAIAEREKALADLKAEKATIEGWCKSSDKITEIIKAQIPSNVKSGLGYSDDQEESDSDRSMLKFGTFISSIPDYSSQSSSTSEIRPSKTSKLLKTSSLKRNVFDTSASSSEK
ncbi:hypothetical protein Tco_0419634, partial [Tanacetum coccineum]